MIWKAWELWDGHNLLGFIVPVGPYWFAYSGAGVTVTNLLGRYIGDKLAREAVEEYVVRKALEKAAKPLMVG